MSKEYWGFSAEDGETAFLAGVVDVLSDELSLHIEYPQHLDADIFYVEDNDISKLNEAVKARMHTYKDRYGCDQVTHEDIDSINFDLEYAPVREHENDEKRKYKDEYEKASAEFYRKLEWYVGKSSGEYSPVSLPDKNIRVLGPMYMSFAWYYHFTAYQDYFVLVIIGTSE